VQQFRNKTGNYDFQNSNISSSQAMFEHGALTFSSIHV